MAVGYDAVTPQSIPPNTPPPDFALGYINGVYPSFNSMVVRFPTSHHVPISAIPGGPNESLAIVCDGEKGDYNPTQSAIFCHSHIASGIFPTSYCSLSEWPAYQQAVIDIGLNVTQVDWWIAAYPGNGPYLYPGTIGHQFADRGTYDESVFLDSWQPGRPTTPTPPPFIPPSFKQPVPIPNQEPLMNVDITFGLTGNDGTAYVPVPIPPNCTHIVAGSIDVAYPYGNPPHHDLDINQSSPTGPTDATGVSFQPVVTNNPPGKQYVRLSGGAPNHFYTGHAIFV